MPLWITENLATIFIGMIVAVLIALALWYLYRSHRRGGCAGCPGCSGEVPGHHKGHGQCSGCSGHCSGTHNQITPERIKRS